MRRLFPVLIAFISIVASAATKKPKLAISNVAVDISHQTITVVFKTPVPQTTNLNDSSQWGLIFYSEDWPQGRKVWPPVSDIVPTPSLRVTVIPDRITVFLDTSGVPLPAGTTSLLVLFGGAELSWVPPPAAPKTPFLGASNKGDANNYVTGLYSPALHSAAQYNVDAQGSYVRRFRESRVWMGGIATMSTNNRPTADPDSYLVSGLLEWVPRYRSFLYDRALGVGVVWDFAGVEFDRKTTTKTIISSPAMEIPFILWPKPNRNIRVFSSGMTFYAGVETGSNISNALNPAGSGFILRGLVGSSVNFTINPNWKYLSQIKLTSNYTARIPATDEIFTHTHYISATGKTVDLPVLSHQVRNHVKTELDLTVAKPFSITIKHEYGELPPGFRAVHSVSVGLSLMLKQTNGPRSNVNPEN